MYDMHYDLLTILYYNFKKNNKHADLNKLIKDCKIRYNSNYKQDNIIGGIVNLYFTSIDEMYNELGISKEETLSVKKMFKQSIVYLDYMKNIGVIPKNIDFIYSIEGCDYLDSYKDLEELYELGLRSILPVWNNKNKFASGNRSNNGITEEGIKLIEKALELGIIIDVSHANIQSFNDILDVVEKHNDYTLIASHSNVRKLCNRDRNLDDKQLTRLKDLGGYIGLFTNGNFLSLNNKELLYSKRAAEYIKHLDYLINKIGFSTDKIIVSTDDMNYHPDNSYHKLEAFPIKDIATNLHKTIAKNFNDELANKILIENPKKLIKKVK